MYLFIIQKNIHVFYFIFSLFMDVYPNQGQNKHTSRDNFVFLTVHILCKWGATMDLYSFYTICYG